MFLLSIYADRQWQAEIEMLYENMVKFFIPDGDATIVVRRKKEVVRLDSNNICMHAYYYCICMHDYKLLLWCGLLH